jgi:hypothetical protein
MLRSTGCFAFQVATPWWSKLLQRYKMKMQMLWFKKKESKKLSFKLFK